MKRALVLAIALAIAGGAIVLAWTKMRQSSGREAAYPVVLASGVRPRMTSSAVASIVLQRLGGDATIERISLLVSESAVPTIERYAGRPNPRLPQIGPVWVVRARGSFVSKRGPGPSPIRASTGYYEIADRDGAIIGMGMP